MERIGRYTPVVLLALLLAFAMLHYGAVLRDPNGVLLANKGDGLKNYYTFLWQVEHGERPLHFSGMNHPYGEHFLFTDGHPALAWGIRALDHMFPFIGDHAIGLLNLCLILGLVITGFVLYRLLRDLGVRPWTAAACALGITVLAPQVDRLGGHLALSWSMCIPLTWWLVLRCHRSDRPLGWYVACAVNTLFWLFTHTYLGVMAAVFGGGLAVMSTVLERPRRTRAWTRALWAVVAGCMFPLAAFTVLIRLTDTHSGRSEHPTGIFNYTAEPDDVLLPTAPPLRPLLDQWTNGAISTQWEASAYVGLATTLICLTWLFGRLRRSPVHPARTLPVELRSAWIPAFLLLLFAFCFPFKSWPSLLDMLPVVEQFRAVGRFTWPFYFVVTVFAATVLDQWVGKDIGRSWGIRSWMALAVPLTWVVEGWTAHERMGGKLSHGSPFIQAAEDLQQMDIPFLKQHQAILPLPYFNFGSESFTRPSLDGITQAALPLSHQLRIPILGSILSRVSVPESRTLTQLVSAAWYDKPLADLLDPSRPYLIVRSKEPLTASERELLSHATPIGSLGDALLYSITHEALFRDARAEEWDHFDRTRSTLVVRGDLLCSDTLSIVHRLDGADAPCTSPHAGVRCFTGPKLGVRTLGTFTMEGIATGDTIMVSLWCYNATPEALNHGLRLETVQGSAVSSISPNEAEHIDGDWSLVEFPVVAVENNPHLELRTVCRTHLERTLTMDDLLLRRSGQDVYWVERSARDGADVLFKNGHRITRPH